MKIQGASMAGWLMAGVTFCDIGRTSMVKEDGQVVPLWIHCELEEPFQKNPEKISPESLPVEMPQAG